MNALELQAHRDALEGFPRSTDPAYQSAYGIAYEAAERLTAHSLLAPAWEELNKYQIEIDAMKHSIGRMK